MSRVALVTGASRGIGSAIYDALARDGLRTYGCSRTAPASGSTDRWYHCDVSRQDDIRSVVRKITDRENRLDVLINNAGVSFLTSGGRTPVSKLGVEQWDYVLSVNLSSAFHFCREVVPHMVRQGGGVIINIASASVRMGGILASVDYIAAKSGLVGLTKGLAFELGKYNIRVIALAPGRIETDMISDAEFATDWAKDNVPLQRLGVPADVAELAAFLASSRAEYMTGCTIDCNGGWVIC